MNIKAELRIYGVDYYYGTLKVSDDLYVPTMSEETSDNEKGELYQDENGIRLNEFSIEQIGRLSDEVFILEAEEHGNVWSLGGFLREVEAHNFGAKSWAVVENMQFRAYLVPQDEDDNPIRVDIDQLLMRVADVGYSL